MKNEVKTGIEVPLADFASLFDEQFMIEEFDEVLEKTDMQSDSVIDSAKRAVCKAVSKQDDESDYKYVVQMDGGIKEAIESGDITLVTNTDGDVFAQLRGADGKFGSRLPIKKELQEEGVSVESLEFVLQMDAIRDQLKNILDTMKDIESRVIEVIQGQHNDRLGLYYSGLALYAESREIRDEFFRKQITAQALKSLSDANAQMIQEMRTSIQYLITGQYKKTKKMTEKIDEQLTVIHQCFDIVWRASFLKAAIYQQNGEISSMLTAITEYGRLVEKMIVPYAGKLSELDKNNALIETGTWGTIANTLEGCQALKQRISAGTVYYLGQGEKKYGD